MGAKSSRQSLAEVRTRVRARTGSIQLSGRYHRLPRKIEDDYVVQDKVLGTGVGGPVYLAKSQRASKGKDKLFAVKVFKLRGISRELLTLMQTEVEIFLQMDHPHVCTLYDVYESDESLQLVMECLEGGELHERISNCRTFSERTAADGTYQMLLAINYIHNRGIVHRDLKLENFLFDAKGSDHIKLIDFGLGKVWSPNRKMKAQLGTLAYLAPEVFLKSYTSKCDIWSLGVIVWVLLVGYLPFKLYADQEQTVLDILNGDWKKDEAKWRRVSPKASDFVFKLLERDPDKRLSAIEALGHPWLELRLQKAASPALDQAVVNSLCEFANASRFRRACMQVMAWSLNSEERARVHRAFIEMDRSKRGCIKLHELRDVLEENFNIGNEEARKIFQALDSTNNEEIYYSEFLAAMMSSRIQIHEDLVRAAFMRIDEDNTGEITLDDLRRVLGESLDGEQVEKLVQEARLMSDGTLNFGEFMAYLCGGEAQEAHQDAVGKIIEASIQQREPLEQAPPVAPMMIPKRGRRSLRLPRLPYQVDSPSKGTLRGEGQAPVAWGSGVIGRPGQKSRAAPSRTCTVS